ncbi:DUF397 domain-containing protein [Actinoplanes sp. NPDC026670]|uniref:DUF397 domain-containing protein n=1 Tax=Actinoplanes sp. NPDC026670 TaxID=3154700 RepID=UPI0033F9DCA5
MEFDRDNLPWRKARKSSAGNCVEIARMGDSIAVRNSRFPDAGIILYTPAEFDAFIDGVKRGEFDEFAR